MKHTDTPPPVVHAEIQGHLHCYYLMALYLAVYSAAASSNGDGTDQGFDADISSISGDSDVGAGFVLCVGVVVS